MRLKSFWLNLVPGLLLSSLIAQPVANSVLTAQAPPHTALKKSGEAEIKVVVSLKPGYHVNSNKPADDYLIPLRLSFDTTPLEAMSVQFPQPKMEKYAFSEKPLSVYSGSFEIKAKVKAKADARMGMNFATAKLRYQACDDNSCLPPKTIEVRIPFDLN